MSQLGPIVTQQILTSTKKYFSGRPKNGQVLRDNQSLNRSALHMETDTPTIISPREDMSPVPSPPPLPARYSTSMIISSTEQRRMPFRSTSLEDRSRTPSPGLTAGRLHPDDFGLYPTRSPPSPLEEEYTEDRIPYTTGTQRRRLPPACQEFPRVSRSPSLPEPPPRPPRSQVPAPLVDDTDHSTPIEFPRLCASPSEALYGDYENEYSDESGAGLHGYDPRQPYYRRGPPIVDHIPQSNPSLHHHRPNGLGLGLGYHQTMSGYRSAPLGRPPGASNGPMAHSTSYYSAGIQRKLPETINFGTMPPAQSIYHHPRHAPRDYRPVQTLANGGLTTVHTEPSIIRAQPGNIPLSDSEQEEI